MKSKKHLRFAGLRRQTLRAYQNAMDEFLFRHHLSSFTAIKPSKLDKLLGEHLNSMFQEGEPLSYAGHLLSALKRFHPQLRLRLPISSQYYKNWCKTYTPSRAVPASFPLVEAMLGVSFQRRNPAMAALVGVGFDAMLRTSELLAISPNHILFHRDGKQASLVIPTSKTSQGNPQIIAIHDQHLLRLLAVASPKKHLHRPLWRDSPHTFRKEFQEILHTLGFPRGSYQPYSLRRGGATHHFMNGGSLDHTIQKGRWACSKTARQYIDSGVSQLAHLAWSKRQSSKVLTFRGIFRDWRLRQKKNFGRV